MYKGLGYNIDIQSLIALWQGVLLRACLDAKKSQDSKTRQSARDFILYDPYYDDVCAMAQIDCNYARNGLIAYLKDHE